MTDSEPPVKVSDVSGVHTWLPVRSTRSLGADPQGLGRKKKKITLFAELMGGPGSAKPIR